MTDTKVTNRDLRYIPTGYTKVTYKKPVDAVAYVQINYQGEGRSKGKSFAIGYSGNSKNHDFHYSFKSAEIMQEKLAKWFEACIEREESRIKRRVEAKNETHDLLEGEILVSTWGYDQTNVDFYQVVKVISDKTVIIQEIQDMSIDENKCYMQDYRYPCRDQFVGKPMKKRARGNGVKIESFAWASRWNYEKVLQTSYA